MLKLATLKYRTKCRKHPRYNPEEGQGAIKGGCKDCTEPFAIYEAHQKLIRLIRQRPQIAERKRKEKPGPVQATIFDMMQASA